MMAGGRAPVAGPGVAVRRPAGPWHDPRHDGAAHAPRPLMLPPLRFCVLLLAQRTAAFPAKADDAQRRGIRWAVNEPAAVAPWLLHGAMGWANTSQPVSSASVGIIVQPVFSITTSGRIVVAYPDKLQDGSLTAYSAAGHDIILLIGPWVGSVGGFVDRSGGYTGPSHSGLNCSSLTTQAEALAKHCVLPDQIVRAALARKEAFAQEFLALLKANRATGFGTDWETSYGNNQTNAAALWGYVKSVIKPHGMKYMPWINNGGGGNMGPSNYAYCNDYFPLLPFADSLLNMGSYGAVGYSFGPGNARSIAPVLCTNRSAGVIEPSTAPAGRWCGLGGKHILTHGLVLTVSSPTAAVGTVKDILTHGGRKSQLSPGIWMSGCCSGSGASSQLCRQLGPVSTTTTRGWTQKRLQDFLAYVGSQGATTVTVWSGLEASKKPWNATFPAAVDTCPWFVPTLLEWARQVAPLKNDDHNNGDDEITLGITATILARTQVLRAAKYGCPGYPYPVPPPPPPGPCTSCIRMLACNASDLSQRWAHPSNGAISPQSSAQQCITRESTGAPLSISICRGHAGSLDPAQQFFFNSSTDKIYGFAAQGVPGDGCVDIGSNPRGGTESILHYQTPCKSSVNENFLYDAARGWIFSNCSGINCAREPTNDDDDDDDDDRDGLQATYCATAPQATVEVQTDANRGAAENCVPWNIDKNETRVGYYFDGGPSSLALSSNDTLLSFHCGEKTKHLDDNNHGDIILRRSFDQGRTWQPWQLVFSPSAFYAPHIFAAQVGTVLDRSTGTIWAVIAANNSMMLVTSSTDHGATWQEAKDISVASKPPGYGWIAPISNGIQLQSGRLAVCADHIKGQWSAYPITHTISSMIYSDDHGISWHWQEHGSVDGALANECSFAQLENKSLVMNSRNYIGQQTHSVKRAIMWSHDEGKSWSPPYFNPDLPSPICEGDMITAEHTPSSLGVGQPLLFTHPQSALDRANGTLLMSTTGGARWNPLLTYQHGCHSYSQMVQFNDGKLGIVFDDGGPFPASYDPQRGQCKGITSNQTFVLVELSKSSEGKGPG